MTLRQKKQVKEIVSVLQGQKFYDFYVSNEDSPKCLFDNYLQNRMDNPELKKETEEKILKMFAEVLGV
ncbi:MAG: hypothetical protein WCT77_02980 [Bacteroidota bacterium]|jgi:hypothetical protein